MARVSGIPSPVWSMKAKSTFPSPFRSRRTSFFVPGIRSFASSGLLFRCCLSLAVTFILFLLYIFFYPMTLFATATTSFL